MAAQQPPKHNPALLSSAAASTVDVRKACNGIKRTAALLSAAAMSRVDGAAAFELAHEMAIDVLKAIGFDVADEGRIATVLPLMLEATSQVLADAVRHAPASSGAGNFAQAARASVSTLIEVAKSRAVLRLIEPAYPADIDSVVALRMSAAAAMACVAVEVSEFDFVHRPQDCIKEAGRTVVNAALEGASLLAPAHASKSARLMLTQSLIQSAARVYASAWKAVAYEEAAILDAMDEPQREAALSAMGERPLGKLLAPVKERFDVSFLAIAECARSAIANEPAPEPIPPKAPSGRRAAPRP